MSKNCSVVVFSNRAYNTIIRETFDKHPVETGGILLGHVIDGVWVVMEVLPPGINCIFQHAYFEYDQAFVNYLAQFVANQYEIPLQLLGLWHRHPGSMDVFSGTDDKTNSTFASLSSIGTISGLVNVDPNFRMTMYHLDHGCGIEHYNRPLYEQVEIEVGDDIIPEQYFKLKYYSSDTSNLHPIPTRENLRRHSVSEYVADGSSEVVNGHSKIQQPIDEEEDPYHKEDKGLISLIKRNKRLASFTLIFVVGFCVGSYFQGHISSWEEGICEYVVEKAESLKLDKSNNSSSETNKESSGQGNKGTQRSEASETAVDTKQESGTNSDSNSEAKTSDSTEKTDQTK